MGYIGKVVCQKRGIPEFKEMFYAILDRGFEAVNNNAHDQKIFNVTRKLILDEPLTTSDEITCAMNPVVHLLATELKAELRVDHMNRLISKTYLKKTRCAAFKDAELIANVFQDTLVMSRPEVAEKYNIEESSVQRIRSRVINSDKYDPEYGAAKEILNKRNILIEAHTCVRSHTLQSKTKRAPRLNDIVVANSSSTSDDANEYSFRDNLIKLAKQSSTIQVLMENETARNLFYALLSSLD